MTRDTHPLPASWVSVALIDVCDKIQDGTHFSPKFQLPEGRHRYVTAKNVRSTGLDLSDVTYLRPEDHLAIYRRCDVRRGDVLLVKDGVNTGDVALNTLDDEISLLSSVCFLRPSAGMLSASFLRYFLMSPVGNSALTGRMSGTAIRRIVLHRIKQTQVVVAPTREQARIVDALDECLPRIEAAVSSLARAEKKLKAYRASVLKAAVEGRLVPTEAELARTEGRSYEPADLLLERILKERRRRWEDAELAKMNAAGKTSKDDKWKAKYEAPVAADTSELPRLPEGWCWSTVDQLAGLEKNALCDGPFGSNLKTEHYTDDGPRVIRLQNIGDGEFQDEEAHISEEHFHRLKKHSVRCGDLVVASLGTELPRACQVPAWFGPGIVKADCLRFNVNETLAEPRFVLHALNALPTRKRVGALVHGVGRPRIGLTLFRQTAIPLPPRSEQERIAEQIERLVSVARAVDLSLTAETRRSNRLRQAVLRWAFEGKLVDQDPADEPADTMLARIRDGRVAAAQVKPRRTRTRKLKAAS